MFHYRQTVSYAIPRDQLHGSPAAIVPPAAACIATALVEDWLGSAVLPLLATLLRKLMV